MPTDHLEDLRTSAHYARERYQLYKAKTHGPRPTSEARLLELQRACEQAQQRLDFAQAEARRARDAGPGPAGPADGDAPADAAGPAGPAGSAGPADTELG